MDIILISFISQLTVFYGFILGREFLGREQLLSLRGLSRPKVSQAQQIWRKAS